MVHILDLYAAESSRGYLINLTADFGGVNYSVNPPPSDLGAVLVRRISKVGQCVDCSGCDTP